jgi:hypothetical protein
MRVPDLDPDHLHNLQNEWRHIAEVIAAREGNWNDCEALAFKRCADQLWDLLHG